jgi:hypothetical protein
MRHAARQRDAREGFTLGGFRSDKTGNETVALHDLPELGLPSDFFTRARAMHDQRSGVVQVRAD